MTAFFMGSFKMSRQILAIRQDAAVCELDGPLITGPITSLKIPGILFIQAYLLAKFFSNGFNIFYLILQNPERTSTDFTIH
jgi:hypothetical protein